MAIQLTCPTCGKLVAAPDSMLGKEGRCPHCRANVRIVPSPPPVAPPPPPKPQPEWAEEPGGPSLLRQAAKALAAIALGALLCAVFLAGVMLGHGRGDADSAGISSAEASSEESDAAETSADASQLPANGGANAGGDLATQAHRILEKSCYSCHGAGGTAEGGFNFILRRDKLVEEAYVIPGSPDDSFLLQRIKDGEMPPEGEGVPPTGEEVALLTRWIESGAPDFSAPLERSFVSNAEVFRLLREDVQAAAARDRRFLRYFSLVHLYNAGISDDELKTYRLAMSKLINSLSRNRHIFHPAAVGGNENLLRIDLRDINWESDIWKKLTDANPYGIVFDDPDAQAVYAATETKMPVLRGDWFVAVATLYHEVLQIPDTLDALLASLNVDVKRNLREDRAIRAGFNNSGVSQNNRLIERHDFRDGAVWISYDFAENTGRRNLFSHPLGPGSEEKHFLHDGGEIIFNLPNGLQAYMLVDGAGKRIDKGPTNIVSDKRRPDRQVQNGISCMSCHFAGIIVKADEIRGHITANPAGFLNDAEDILALYKPTEELTRIQNEDARRFQTALAAVGVDRVTETNEPIANMAARFESNLDLRLAAAEFGLEAQDLAGKLQGHPELARVLGVVNAGGALKRDVFVKVFRQAVTAFKLGTPVGSVDTPTPTSEDLANAAAPAAPKQPAPTQPPTSATPPSLEGTSDLNFRTWTDRTGQFRVRARFVNFAGDIVRLRREDGQIVGVAIERLSEADQKFVLDQPPDSGFDLPPEAQPLFGDNPYNPPEPDPHASRRGPYSRRPPLIKYPDAPLYKWHPSTHDEFLGYFHDLEAGRLSIRLPNGIVLNGPVTDMSPDDLQHIRSIIGEEAFAEHFGPPQAAFDAVR